MHCGPTDTAEASGVRILNDRGHEIFHVCQDGTLLPQTGFANVTNGRQRDFLFVTQVGAKTSEATLYRKSGRTTSGLDGGAGGTFMRKSGKTVPRFTMRNLNPQPSTRRALSISLGMASARPKQLCPDEEFPSISVGQLIAFDLIKTSSLIRPG